MKTMASTPSTSVPLYTDISISNIYTAISKHTKCWGIPF